MRVFSIFTGLLLSLSLQSQDIKIGEIRNKIMVGDLVGNRSITFGIKNVLEEAVQDQGVYLNPNSKNVLELELLFFDVQKNSTQIAVFGKNVDIYQIVVRGIYTKGDKKPKVKVAKGTAKSISTSTLVIDQGGKFSQANVSTAIKKVCVNLIEQLKL